MSSVSLGAVMMTVSPKRLLAKLQRTTALFSKVIPPPPSMTAVQYLVQLPMVIPGPKRKKGIRRSL